MRKYLLCCLGLCRRSPGRKCTLTTVQNEQFGKSKGIRKSFFFSPEPGTRSRVPAWGSAAVSAAQQPPRRPAGVGRGGGSCLGSAWKTGAARGLCHFVAAGRRVTALSPEGGRAQAHAARPPRRAAQEAAPAARPRSASPRRRLAAASRAAPAGECPCRPARLGLRGSGAERSGGERRGAGWAGRVSPAARALPFCPACGAPAWRCQWRSPAQRRERWSLFRSYSNFTRIF